jgi:hypothetical protein
MGVSFVEICGGEPNGSSWIINSTLMFHFSCFKSCDIGLFELKSWVLLKMKI